VDTCQLSTDATHLHSRNPSLQPRTDLLTPSSCHHILTTYHPIPAPPQDSENLYMGLEYCPNGELYQQLEARQKLQLPEAVQWAAEVVDILEYLRAKEVIHR